MNYDKAPLCVQQGVFRVNCVDCLDRTNYVQSVIAKEFLQMAVSNYSHWGIWLTLVSQLQKLGLLSPFKPLLGQFLRHYQEMWGNNGDTVSKQYAGTVAMKVKLSQTNTVNLHCWTLAYFLCFLMLSIVVVRVTWLAMGNVDWLVLSKMATTLLTGSPLCFVPVIFLLHCDLRYYQNLFRDVYRQVVIGESTAVVCCS